MLDEREFLSPYGIRALSRIHKDHPYVLHVNGMEHRVDYEPAESSTGLFGGNSNWRGPIWFPVNYPDDRVAAEVPPLLRRRLQGRVPDRLGPDDDAVGGGGRALAAAVEHLPARTPTAGGRSSASDDRFQHDPHWRDLILFHEYFHGDDGSAVGASHQTGWTGLVAKLLQQSGEPATTSTRRHHRALTTT